MEGPYDWTTLQSWFTSGAVPGETFVSNNGGEWVELQSADPVGAGGGVLAAAAEAPAEDWGEEGWEEELEEWSLLVGEDVNGPYTASTMRAWLADGILAGTHCSNGGEWIECETQFG